MPQNVLFLCTHNSARSQMAEGLLRQSGGDFFEVHSAGSVATGVRDEAVKVMEEVGIDLSRHESKSLDRFLYRPFDWVVTVCDHARDTCPTFPNAERRLHWSVPDPAAVTGSESERLAAFRAAREDLARRIREEILEPSAAARAALAPRTGWESP